MRRICLALFAFAALSTTGVTLGQDSKDAPASKDAPKAKGFLPQNWKDLGLTDEQRQKVLTLQNKYGEDIDKLEAQIKELKAKLAKERLEILTKEQKARLEEVLKAKAGGGK